MSGNPAAIHLAARSSSFRREVVMITRPRTAVTLVGLLLLAGLASRTPADETQAPDDAQEKLRITKELVEKAANEVKVLPDGEAEVPLQPEVVLRWQNPVRVQTGAAVLAIWTDNGRPEAMASIFVWNGDLCHEFGSLSRQGKLTVSHKSSARLSLREPGVVFKPVPDSPPPADTPAARLRQMKSIAERFTAKLADQTRNNENTEVLRLLAKPLYRYAIKEPGSDPWRLLDGGMFAYVMGTDPEVVLLLEAVGAENGAAWQYALAIATTHAVEVRLGEQVVWSRRGFASDAPHAEVFLRRRLAD
jgi:hypothetical protein